MTRPALLLLGLGLLLPGCGLLRRPPAATPSVRYVVGGGYQAGGTWYYPREAFRYEAAGLAEIVSDRSGLTADGEVFDPAAAAASHQTLQLPAIARVTNLETGLQMLVRINDRGPASPARLLGLTRQAAASLGVPPGGVARVRVQVQDAASQALRDSLGGGPAGLQTAPRTEVAAQDLAPPPGVAQSGRVRVAATGVAAASAPVAEDQTAKLDGSVQRVPADPGQLWISAGEFGQASYANQVQARLAGLSPSVARVPLGRSTLFRVRAGPFPSVAAADAALDRALAAGVTDARIIVE